MTKRNVSKIANKLFDPSGFVCSIVVQVKLIINKICILKTGCDIRVPLEIEKVWKLFLNFLKNSNDISFDRYLFANQNKFVLIELHGYCDASKSDYFALIYAKLCI